MRHTTPKDPFVVQQTITQEYNATYSHTHTHRENNMCPNITITNRLSILDIAALYHQDGWRPPGTKVVVIIEFVMALDKLNITMKLVDLYLCVCVCVCVNMCKYMSVCVIMSKKRHMETTPAKGSLLKRAIRYLI